MDQKTVLSRLKKELAKKLDITQVYLFGSRAKGTFFTDSDYDIAVISSTFEGLSFFERQQLIRPLIRKVLGVVSLDVACYTEEEFEQGKHGFLPEVIKRDGIMA